MTAYVSYVCGAASEWLVGPETVELFGSRGYEDPIHKAFMRGTVLVLDVMIYYSAVYVLSKRLGNNESERLWILILALMQVRVECRSYQLRYDIRKILSHMTIFYTLSLFEKNTASNNSDRSWSFSIQHRFNGFGTVVISLHDKRI